MRNLSVKKLAMTGVMAALVFVMTYVPKVPVPATGGYVHLGDGAIFLAALTLGPLGIPAAAIGSGLSDLMGGYVVYALPTVVIKGLMAFAAWKICREGAWLRTALAFLLAEAVMVAGYFLFETVTFGAASAWGAVGPNCIQGAAGVVLGMVCSALTPRLRRMLKRI